MNFYLDTSTEKIIGIATLKGRIDAHNCDELQKAFVKWLDNSADIVLDCQELDFIDSSGLGTIVFCLRKTLEHHGDLKLVGLSPKVAMIFEITKAKKLFSIYTNTTEAILSFNHQEQA